MIRDSHMTWLGERAKSRKHVYIAQLWICLLVSGHLPRGMLHLLRALRDDDSVRVLTHELALPRLGSAELRWFSCCNFDTPCGNLSAVGQNKHMDCTAACAPQI